MKHALLILIVLLAGCTVCENQSVENCPESCELCGDSIISSYAECHSKEYCESVRDCSTRLVDICEPDCQVCPPCEECSAITCQAPEYCQKMGFDKEWYDRVRP